MGGRLQLAKVPLCLLIGCSTLFGAILAQAHFTWSALILAMGVFVLATGGASLNSLQEHRLDAQMERTRNRPLPQRRISLTAAAWQAALLLLAGMVMVALASSSILASATALFALILYNGVYTPLKKRSVLAIFPGALCGALPPYIGWLGAGGYPVSYEAVLIVALFVLWQVPHYWLVMLNFQQDYLVSTQPNFLKQLQAPSIKRFFVTWIGALALVMIMFVVLPPGMDTGFSLALISNATLLLAVFIHGLVPKESNNYPRLFMSLNISLLVHMVIVCAGRLVA
jgi:protoheme IX farnesyltransferase